MSRVLYVYAKGGTALEHAFPRIAAHAELHVLALMPLPTAAADHWRPHCASITEATVPPGAASGDTVTDEIVRVAKEIGADAVLTLSEFAVLAVAHAADRLGLRGAGPAAAERARDKRLMREVWAAAGVPVPAFRRVGSEAELRTALTELTPPVLLKAAWSAGSIAQLVLRSPDDAATAWPQVAQALDKGREIRMSELYETGADRALIVEEIIEGSAADWYGSDSGKSSSGSEVGDEGAGGGHGDYGDYVSVEGIVAGGVHHALCVTARMPPIPPFNEVASTAPCVLSEARQRQIEEVAGRAVDALGLDTCGTHTELKLRADGGIAVIETAARFGGVMITRMVEEVFGLDPISLLVRELLGEEVAYPSRMPVSGRGAAASLVAAPADAVGTPWRTRPAWRPRQVEWDGIVTPGTAVEPVAAFDLPPDHPIPDYDPAAGAANWLGVLFVTAADAPTLLKDCTAVLGGLEEALNRVAPVEPGDRRRG
ncbi:ATP-grasp domain-containing protein [Streptomyces sp. NPDC000594]|uniref:ATP-grasp domain-containing protein n=1 Tax=Streptomyces sp. NPDC000594 TaxID=3154261 RepID=UPI0033286A25